MSVLPTLCPFLFLATQHRAGDIAQLARAAALQAVGRGFESHYLHFRAYGALAGGALKERSLTR